MFYFVRADTYPCLMITGNILIDPLGNILIKLQQKLLVNLLADGAMGPRYSSAFVMKIHHEKTA